ncbi:MAG: hypothetical protein KJ063_25685 [Anaerolineae bacterium]|nr:hypothetical protein [Anaerolineae bacterium]
MKNGKFLFAIKLYVISISLVLVGCTSTSPAFTPTNESVSSENAIVATTVPPTQPPLPATQLPSAIPSLTPTPTSTLTPTPTIQPTATETPFAIPTPPGIDTNEQVLWLLSTNNGCQLPCWWGITPGETEWKAAEEILTLFDANIYAASASGIDYYNPTIPLPFGPYEVNQVSPIYTVQGGIVEKIETQVSIGDAPTDYFPQYTLPTFLTTYGQPGEVWMNTYPSAFEDNDLPFFVVLFYPDQGIVAVFDDNGEQQGDMVQGCPQEKPVSGLVLLPPGLNNTFGETVSKTSGLGQREYLSLEEATGMDVTTFYETFKNPDNTTCLETPANLWR